VGTHTIVATYTGSPNFNGSPSGGVGLTVYTPIQSYVEQVYRDLLHREADPGGLAFWSGLLADPRNSRADIVFYFQSTPEYLGNEVAALYQSLLRRPASPTDISNGIKILTNQTLFLPGRSSLDFLKSQILGSQEYYNRQGLGTDPGWLNAVYLDTLGRPLDQGGFNTFEGQLRSGTPRTVVALSIASSHEAHLFEVQQLYQQYLHRAPDANGLAFFANVLDTGHNPDLVIANLLASPEYFANL
jgi:uncharacterized protein DUF4214